MYYLAYIKLESCLHWHMATLFTVGSCKNLEKAKERLENDYPRCVVQDLFEISQETYWFRKDYSKIETGNLLELCADIESDPFFKKYNNGKPDADFYYIAHLKLKGETHRCTASTFSFSSTNDLKKTRKKLEKRSLEEPLVDFHQFSFESFNYESCCLSIHSHNSLLRMLDEYEKECEQELRKKK